MNPGWEVDVSRATEVRASRVVWPWRQEVRLFQSMGVPRVGSETTSKVTDRIMASHNVSGGHAEAGMATFGVQHRITARAKLVVGVDGHTQTALQFDDEFGWVEGEPQNFRRDTREEATGPG